jgi:predicted Zn-dependent protease
MTLNTYPKIIFNSTLLILLICFSKDLIAVEPQNTLHHSLPTIGNSSSSLVSIEQEKILGKAWLRALRQQTKIYDNAIVENYLRNLIYSLAPNSQVIDRDFRFVIVDSTALNAFAVPGSIIGINSGLFFHSGSEQQFASVLAHELAHLSQRHFARQLEQQKLSTPLTLAGILASVVLAATTGSDAGLAALASTQALSVDQQLRFSRKNEQEADRLGVEILYQSNYDPRAMPKMFERMFRNSRVDKDSIPEYLSTHPLSETRIADSRNRANQFPQKIYQDSFDYHLCRNIVMTDYSESPQKSKSYFESIISKGSSNQIDAAKFGLAYSQILTDPEASLNLLDDLLMKYPGKITLQIIQARALQENKQSKQAMQNLEILLARNPKNYPIADTLAKIYLKNDLIDLYEQSLVKLSRTQEENPNVWYQLAEAHGLAGHIVELHIARAEYFYLTNRLETALEQLNLALKKNKVEAITAKIQKRMDELYKLKENPVF